MATNARITFSPHGTLMNSFLLNFGHITNNFNIFSSKLKLKGEIRLQGITIMQAFPTQRDYDLEKDEGIGCFSHRKNANISE
jgi:hypothetical protein